MSLVSVIIVTHNSADHLNSCLPSVREQEETFHEIIVVDNASTDSTRAMVRECFPEVHLLENEHNRGFAAAVNQGLSHVEGHYVLLLNPDTTLLPSSIAPLVDVLEITPDAAAAGPRQWLDATMTWQWSIIPRPPDWRLLLQNSVLLRRIGLANRTLKEHWALNRSLWRGSRPFAVPFLSGASLLIRKEALQTVGGLDEGYFLFAEDTDLCTRLRSRGWRLFAVPEAAVVHRGFHSVSMEPLQGRDHLMRSTARYLGIHGSGLSRAVWFLVSAYRIMRRTQPPAPAVTDGCIRLHEGTVAGSTEPAWVEIGLEPLFLYAAATEIDTTSFVLPEQLLKRARHGALYMRTAPIDPAGALGTVTPHRQLSFAVPGTLPHDGSNR